jgi:hypothetical protein
MQTISPRAQSPMKISGILAPPKYQRRMTRAQKATKAIEGNIYLIFYLLSNIYMIFNARLPMINLILLKEDFQEKTCLLSCFFVDLFELESNGNDTKKSVATVL